MRILVFNCGSSSAKFQLIEFINDRSRDARVIGRGNFERIGESHPNALLIDSNGSEARTGVAASDHSAAVRETIDWLERSLGQDGLKLDATAHRIVHGGPRVFGPSILDDALTKDLEEATTFAPLHNPPALAAIRAVKERLPGLPAVILTDTAFHRDLPDVARHYAIPRELANRHDIRRFGFHGIGHAWMMTRYAELADRDAATLNLITLHLGAGCSATAIRGGRSVDTSMGLTPLEGLMMATRSGDLDPAIVRFLCEREQISPAKVESILNHQSGLLGVSGVSRDIRDVAAAALAGNADAALAIEMFCYRVRKYIGQYLAIEGETEAIIFGGGIGEHADQVRLRICCGLERLGITLDRDLNQIANGREFCFSSNRSPIKLYVIPLSEELYIARATAALLDSRPTPKP